MDGLIALALAKKYTDEHGGSGLPPVTTEDNGKILQVVNGIWTVVTIPLANGEEF